MHMLRRRGMFIGGGAWDRLYKKIPRYSQKKTSTQEERDPTILQCSPKKQTLGKPNDLKGKLEKHE